MNELATLPASIRQRLELAQTLASQNRPQEAANVLSQVGAELARTHPELCALIAAAQMGYTRIDSIHSERTTGYERVEYKLFGFPIAEEWVPVTTTKTVMKSYRLSK